MSPPYLHKAIDTRYLYLLIRFNVLLSAAPFGGKRVQKYNLFPFPPNIFSYFFAFYTIKVANQRVALENIFHQNLKTARHPAPRRRKRAVFGDFGNRKRIQKHGEFDYFNVYQ